jgi:hypothetical protein
METGSQVRRENNVSRFALLNLNDLDAFDTVCCNLLHDVVGCRPHDLAVLYIVSRVRVLDFERVPMSAKFSVGLVGATKYRLSDDFVDWVSVDLANVQRSDERVVNPLWLQVESKQQSLRPRSVLRNEMVPAPVHECHRDFQPNEKGKVRFVGASANKMSA